MSRRDVPRTYTIVNEYVGDEDGNVVAATFGGVTRALPPVVDEITISELRAGRAELWWLPMDLAIGGGLVLSALRVATRLRLLPVLERAAVANADELALVTAAEVAVPSYASDAPERRAAVHSVRVAIRDLLAGQPSAADVHQVADLVEQLRRDHPGDQVRTASLALLRFPHLDGTLDYPALLVTDLGWGKAPE